LGIVLEAGVRVAGALLVLALTTTVRAQLLGPLPVPTLGCWEAVRLFSTLGAGNFGYCRGHLRYSPGALDCFQIVDRVCLVYLPGSVDWTEVRNPRAHIPIVCPRGPEPPVCRRLDLQ
jgi:hypothetical protein